MAFNIYGIVRIFLTVVNILFVYPKQYDDFVYEAGQHQQPQYNIEVEVATRRR